MSRIDWRDLFDERRVDYIEAGANVRRGELNIRCPFCGSSDPSYHMGVSLETGWWSCWRNRSQHSGKSPVRLLMRLFGVSYGEALQIAGLDETYIDPEGFSAIAARVRALRDRGKSFKGKDLDEALLELLPNFVSLRPAGLTRRHWNYLDGRWFDPDTLAVDYGVVCGLDGGWKDRVIFPYFEMERLVTWTGRAIGPAEIRYKDLPLRPKEGYDGPLALTPAKETLYNHDCMLEGGKWLILQEGPIDALKMDCFGKRHAVRSVALSTSSISDEQLARLDKFASGFDHIGVMMDMVKQLDLVHSIRMRNQIRSVHRSAHVLEVPFGRKDAGELKPGEVNEFCTEITSRIVKMRVN